MMPIDTKLFQNIPGHLYIKNREGVVVWCNIQQAQMFGFKTVEKLIGKTDFDVFTKDIALRIRDNDLRIMQLGEPEICEEHFLFNNRNYIFISHKSPLKNQFGEVEGVVGISIDITKQKSSHEDTCIALRHIIDVLPGHVYWKDTKGIYLGANNKQAEYFGLSNCDQIIGKSDSDFLYGNVARKIKDNDKKIIKTKEVEILEEIASIDGKEINFISNKSPLRDSKGNVVGVLGVSIDITKQKVLEKKYIERTRDLSKALEVKREFLKNMSHEVRTPLQGMTGIAYGLHQNWDKLTDAQKKGYVKTIVDSQDRLMNLMSNLLDLSKFDSGKFSFEFKYEDVRMITIDIVDEFKNITSPINLEIPLNIDTQVMCDSIRISQVIRNLIANAVKHGGKDKPIAVEFSKHKEDGKKYLKISVSDEGLGIPEDEIAHIFESFYESSRTKRRSGGTGLGLSICNDIIRTHKGRIWAKNKKDLGAIFHFILPYEEIDDKKNYSLRLTQKS